MKKSVILSFAAMLCAATWSYSQTTTGSVDQPAQNKQNQGAQQHKGDQATQPGEPSKQHPGTESLDQDKTSKNITQPASPGAAAQSPVKNDEVRTSDRPGGAAHKNANDVGKYSENEDSKSLLNSKEAIAERRKNRTESDTTLKKGSGSAPKNMKNHTGKTGNFKNGAARHNEPK